MKLPRPHTPGQIHKVSMIDGYVYYYISDMVTRQRITMGDTLSFRLYRMLYNNKYGFVYRPEEIQHVDHSILVKKLATGECVRTIKPKLSYEEFVDTLTEQSKRLTLTTGIALMILNLLLCIIWVILNYG